MLARTLLIVDGNKTTRNETKSFFKNTNYNVESTSSAAYAIAKIVQGHNPLVILGETFEEIISSADVIALMRRCNKQLKIVLISDNNSLDSLKQIYQDGILYHSLSIQTDEDRNDLLQVINHAI